jgi:hypothetical protein
MSPTPPVPEEKRYEYECCQVCGQPTAFERDGEPLTYWHADQALWNRMYGGPDGVLRCMRCFTEECRDAGESIMWQALRTSELDALRGEVEREQKWRYEPDMRANHFASRPPLKRDEMQALVLALDSPEEMGVMYGPALDSALEKLRAALSPTEGER